MQDEEAIRKAVLYDLRQNQTLIGKCKVSGEAKFLHVNDVLCEYLKCTPAQLIGSTFMAITLPDDNEIDVLNAEAVKNGDIDRYQFPKRYKPKWLPYIVYVIIDVLGVRDQNGLFLYYDVEILEISKEDYLRLKRNVQKQESENLMRLLNWTGGLKMKELKGLVIWVALVVGAISLSIQIKIEWVKQWLSDLLQ